MVRRSSYFSLMRLPELVTSSVKHLLFRPRGFPLEDIVKPSPQSFVRDIARPLIQQSLADVDPDVDAIHRLTQPLGITFDSAAFSVLLPGGSFCPFNRCESGSERSLSP